MKVSTMQKVELLSKLGWVLLGITVAAWLDPATTARGERVIASPKHSMAVLDVEEVLKAEDEATGFLVRIEREEKASQDRFAKRVREMQPDAERIKQFDPGSNERKKLERGYYAKLDSIGREESLANEEFSRKKQAFVLDAYQRLLDAVHAIARERQLRLVLCARHDRADVRSSKGTDEMLREWVVVSEGQDITQDVVRKLRSESTKP
jgi:hypothetical protein